ncbi:MAG TPA: VWA domain-containing protein [Candidatus Omnitrophota bacterium]|nr:VWA domain-containing protein [Candidatus Omnitrophota bacterium]HPN56395.1 VWA domain-containing protein [Candidatus Omnitrophota bacterium]
MRFVFPEFFYGLWGLVLLAAFLSLARRRRQKCYDRFAEQKLFLDLAATLVPGRHVFKHGLLLAVFAFSLVALARPQWGYEMREIKRQGLDILLVIDTSRSMLADDVKPNRLERAKLAVRDFLRQLKGDRVGLIAFSGDAFLICPLTVDYGGFLLSLDHLDKKTIPRGGTNIARALQEALREYDNTPSRYKAVIIITDGENLEEDPFVAVKEAKDKGVKIYCVGIGTQSGELIKDADIFGQPSYLKDGQGNIVKSRLNEELLQRIALETGGVYVRASGAEFGLDVIYEKQLARLEKRELETTMAKNYFERFQLPLGAALFFLLWEFFLPLRREDRNGRLDA